MSNADLKGALALADLIRDLALAEDRRKKRFAAIVRFVRRREARGSAKDIMAQTIASANCSLITKRSPKSSE
jgi:hypothetical protein